MAAGNPIIQRIQGHKGRIQGMLTPGLRRPTGEQQPGRVSSVFTGFGGGKLKRVAKKMRVLDVGKLGNIQPQAHQKFAETIPQKFQEVKALIHLSPKFSQETSIWSEIETAHPSQAGGSMEIPHLPGDLRRGSTIQSLPMFPQPGQSLGEFKDTVRSIPKPAKRTIPPRKPRLDPKSQLYSRVQEIKTPVEKPEIEEQISEETPPDTDVVQPQFEKFAPVISEPEPEESLDESVEDVVPLPAPKPALKKAQPVLAKPKPKPAAPELPKAKPAKKAKQAVEPPLALPQAQPSRQASEPAAPGVVQPKREAPTPKIASRPVSPPPKPAPSPESTDQPLHLPPAPEPVDHPLPPLPEPEVQEPSSTEEMPLQKKILANKNIGDTIKALQPETFTPPVTSPLLVPKGRSIIPKRKYRPVLAEVETPKEPLQTSLVGLESAPAPHKPKDSIAEPDLAPPTQIEPLPMSLAYTPRLPQSPSIISQPKELPPADARSLLAWPPVEEELPLEPPIVEEAEEALVPSIEGDEFGDEEIVSRQIDDDEDLVDEEIEPEEEIEDIDLDQLAEDVLPLVKRILEIESERLSRNLH